MSPGRPVHRDQSSTGTPRGMTDGSRGTWLKRPSGTGTTAASRTGPVHGSVSRAVSLLLLPIYSRILRPEEYGQLAIATLITTVVGILLESGQRSAYFRLYFANDSRESRRVLTGTVLIYLIVVAAATFPLLL